MELKLFSKVVAVARKSTKIKVLYNAFWDIYLSQEDIAFPVHFVNKWNIYDLDKYLPTSCFLGCHNDRPSSILSI